ncbi:hypothetical protein PIB30_030232 [Stylosanthes scabra]|uniref:Uncharacterized protein n=1 Tax=Stylosanthes scabra TaxID=79078 RepID=A0ABU6WA10_9FABA|nr:hypothetical protein [Stylosanthes scabra]
MPECWGAPLAPFESAPATPFLLCPTSASGVASSPSCSSLHLFKTATELPLRCSPTPPPCRYAIATDSIISFLKCQHAFCHVPSPPTSPSSCYLNRVARISRVKLVRVIEKSFK